MGDITSAPGKMLGGIGGGGLFGGGGLAGGALNMTGIPQLAMQGLMIFIGVELVFKLIDRI